MPYLVKWSINPNDYVERALDERGRDEGYSVISHLEIISHGWDGHLGLHIKSYRVNSIKHGGSLLLNSCCAAEGSGIRFKQANPDLNIFASDTVTAAAEPIVKDTKLGPQVTDILYASNFISPLIMASKMRKFSSMAN